MSERTNAVHGCALLLEGVTLRIERFRQSNQHAYHFHGGHSQFRYVWYGYTSYEIQSHLPIGDTVLCLP